MCAHTAVGRVPRCPAIVADVDGFSFSWLGMLKLQLLCARNAEISSEGACPCLRMNSVNAGFISKLVAYCKASVTVL